MFLEDEEELLFTIDAAGEAKKKVRKLMIHYLSLYSIEHLGSSSFAFFYSFAPLLPVPLSEWFCRGGSLDWGSPDTIGYKDGIDSDLTGSPTDNVVLLLVL